MPWHSEVFGNACEARTKCYQRIRNDTKHPRNRKRETQSAITKQPETPIHPIQPAFTATQKNHFRGSRSTFRSQREAVTKNFWLFGSASRRVAKRKPANFGTLAGCQKRTPIQSTNRGSGVSGHFGLIRKWSEMSWPRTGKNFRQAEMSRVFWLLSYETFRDDCGICFVSFPNLHVL